MEGEVYDTEKRIGRLPKKLRYLFELLSEYQADGPEACDKADKLREIFWDQVFRCMPAVKKYENLYLREGYIVFGVPKMDEISPVRAWLNRVTHVY
jgi:hypothetical protein